MLLLDDLCASKLNPEDLQLSTTGEYGKKVHSAFTVHIGYQAPDLSCFFLVTENTLVVLRGKKKKKKKKKKKLKPPVGPTRGDIGKISVRNCGVSSILGEKSGQ